MAAQDQLKHLHEQLSEAHAERAGVLAQLGQAQKEAQEARARAAHGEWASAELQKEKDKRKAAEENAAAANATRRKTGTALRNAEDEIKDVQAELERERDPAGQAA
jgi:hypothetical protein